MSRIPLPSFLPFGQKGCAVVRMLCDADSPSSPKWRQVYTIERLNNHLDYCTKYQEETKPNAAS